MSTAIRKANHYTVADYMTWQGEQRDEPVDGEAYLMTPVPVLAHQRTTVASQLRFDGYAIADIDAGWSK